ncbi:MAG: hypothetical protein WCA28_26910 [Bradyrhizobium sp.]
MRQRLPNVVVEEQDVYRDCLYGKLPQTAADRLRAAQMTINTRVHLLEQQLLLLPEPRFRSSTVLACKWWFSIMSYYAELNWFA